MSNVATIKEVMKRQNGFVRIAVEENTSASRKRSDVIGTGIVSFLRNCHASVPVCKLTPKTWSIEKSISLGIPLLRYAHYVP
jgi:hypothetical protein